MHRRHEYRGFWRPADDPSNQLPGTLTVEKGKATLDLIGDFGRQLISSSPREKAYSWDAEPQPRLLGTSVDGKEITIEGAWETNSSMHFPGMPTTSHHARAVLVGGQFARGDEIHFDEIAISAISAWEVAMLEARGRIALDRPASQWIRAALDADPRIVPAPLTASIAVRAARLDGLPGDPADRFIYATARERGASLVTRDEALRRHDPARTIW